MEHPFQCTALLSRSPKHEDLLLAACGSKLLALDLSSGDIGSEWSSDINSSSNANGKTDEERPSKKQKTNQTPSVNPYVIKLTTALDGEHAVAVTDDKLIRVFHINAAGKLQELSQRSMPKRPCAIDILPGNHTILCGDKFGDVYALPMHPKDHQTPDATPEVQEPQPSAEPNFKPSATNLTVHTKRNLRSLEAQMSQKNFTARKEPLAFEHTLLLGHVSMLTDMKLASRQVDSKQRGYILTADRDEHIRVSRGPPQSYVIEGFCMGHEQFISKICLLPDTDLLVSGGGDDWLGVWEWAQFRMVRKIPLRPLLERLGHSDASESPIAVSGLWATRLPEPILLVAIEKVPALFAIAASSLIKTNEHHVTNPGIFSILELDGNPADLTSVNETIIVSQDVRGGNHQRLIKFSVAKVGDDQDRDDVLVFRRENESHELKNKLARLNGIVSNDNASAKTLDEILYSVSNLRKQRDVNMLSEDVDETELLGE